MFKKIFTFIAINLLTINFLYASSEIVTVKNFSEVQKIAQNMAEKKGAASVWMVYDLDNTILTGVHPLARAEWFDWQADMIKENSTSVYRVAQDYDQLILVHSAIFDWTALKPVENNTIKAVKALQQANHPSIILTARGPSSFDATIRELNRQNLSFKKSSKLLKAGNFEPVSIPNAKTVSFSRGVMMATGQDKGIVLKDFLALQQANPKVIIFVDDVYKNIENMARAFKNENNFHAIAIHYTNTAAQVRDFEESDKSSVHEDYVSFAALWKKLQRGN